MESGGGCGGEEGLTRRVKAEVITSKGFATSVFDLLHNSDLVCGDCVVQSQVQIEIEGVGGVYKDASLIGSTQQKCVLGPHRLTTLGHHHHHHQSLNREGRWGTTDNLHWDLVIQSILLGPHRLTTLGPCHSKYSTGSSQTNNIGTLSFKVFYWVLTD